MIAAAVPLAPAAAMVEGTAVRRHADHGEVRRTRQVGIGFYRANALDGVVMRIDQLNVAGKAAAAQILQDGMAGRLFPRTGADDNDGSRRKRFIESIDRHPLSEFSGRLAYDLVGFVNEFKTAMPGTRPGIPILSIATDATAQPTSGLSTGYCSTICIRSEQPSSPNTCPARWMIR